MKTSCLFITEENCKSFGSILRLIMVTRNFEGVISYKASQMCHIMVYGNIFLRKHWQIIQLFFQKKDMENIMIIPWSWYESWKTW